MLSVIEKKFPEHVKEEDIVNLKNKGVNPWVAHALALRGVNDPNIATGNYKIKPFTCLLNIEKIAMKLADAIVAQEKIVIVADYDCDGATACSIALLGLKSLGANIDFIVPNRFKNGYGLTPSVIDQLLPMNPVYILTVDNGIASHQGVEYANNLGIKVLVTDHHLPAKDKEPPCAEVIVNPNQVGDTSGLNNMAGCGVIYYVVAATRQVLRNRNYFDEVTRPAPALGDLLDIVALGTIADVVKLDDNNRWLVRQGIARIRAGKTRPGIKALFEIAGKRLERATSLDFGFALGPRINAAGRLEDMTVGVKCLTTDSEEEAMYYAQMLDDLNKKRKTIEGDMKTFANSVMDDEGQSNKMTRVVFGEDFHEGVIGIVAGRIKELSDCPTIVFAPAEEEGCIKGSGRSVPTLHLRDAIDIVYKKYPDIFKGFGGHAMAAGVTILKEHLELFKAEFEISVHNMMEGKKYEKVLDVDAQLPTSAISIETTRAIEDEVWGQGFPDPTWLGSFKVLEASLMGSDKQHLRLKLEKDGLIVVGVQFFNSVIPEEGKLLDIAYKLAINEFRGNESIQIMITEKDENV